MRDEWLMSGARPHTRPDIGRVQTSCSDTAMDREVRAHLRGEIILMLSSFLLSFPPAVSNLLSVSSSLLNTFFRRAAAPGLALGTASTAAPASARATDASAKKKGNVQ